MSCNHVMDQIHWGEGCAHSYVYRYVYQLKKEINNSKASNRIFLKEKSNLLWINWLKWNKEILSFKLTLLAVDIFYVTLKTSNSFFSILTFVIRYILYHVSICFHVFQKKFIICVSEMLLILGWLNCHMETTCSSLLNMEINHCNYHKIEGDNWITKKP